MYVYITGLMVSDACRIFGPTSKFVQLQNCVNMLGTCSKNSWLHFFMTPLTFL